MHPIGFLRAAGLALLLSVDFTPAALAQRPFLCSDYVSGRVSIVAADGKIEWQYACKQPQDSWRLPNGNILIGFVSGAVEVTRDKAIVWEYKAPPKVEVQSCQPLADGKVLIVECGTSRIIEVDRSGQIVKTVPLVTAPEVKLHNQYRGTRKLANGNYLVCFKGEKKIVEVDESGHVVRSIAVPGDPHGALPLPNGHILVTCGDGHKVIELDANAKVVWELNENDLPDNPLRLMAGAQRLPNGNTIICNYLGHGHIGKQPLFFEVTRDKKVVWAFRDDANFKTINQIMLLDVPGDVTKGEIWR